MNEETTPTRGTGWSDDMLWALATADNAVVLLDPDGLVAYANEAASILASRLQPGGDAGVLLAIVPEPGWTTAAAEGRWIGELPIEVKLPLDLGQGAAERALGELFTKLANLLLVIVSAAVCSSSDKAHDALVDLYHDRFSHQIETAECDEVLDTWA